MWREPPSHFTIRTQLACCIATAVLFVAGGCEQTGSAIGTPALAERILRAKAEPAGQYSDGLAGSIFGFSELNEEYAGEIVAEMLMGRTLNDQLVTPESTPDEKVALYRDYLAYTDSYMNSIAAKFSVWLTQEDVLCCESGFDVSSEASGALAQLAVIEFVSNKDSFTSYTNIWHSFLAVTHHALLRASARGACTVELIDIEQALILSLCPLWPFCKE